MLNGDQVPRDHPAEGDPHVGHGTYARGVHGYTDGIQHGEYPQYIGIPVRPENIGSPILGAIPEIFTGIPRTEGEPPGARGAQFIGIARHPQPQNPQASPSARFFTIFSTHASACGESPIEIIPHHASTLVFTKGDELRLV